MWDNSFRTDRLDPRIDTRFTVSTAHALEGVGGESCRGSVRIGYRRTGMEKDAASAPEGQRVVTVLTRV